MAVMPTALAAIDLKRAVEAQDDDELEGEDLHEEGYTADYRALPLLDTYEGRAGSGRREYERISEDAEFFCGCKGEAT